MDNDIFNLIMGTEKKYSALQFRGNIPPLPTSAKPGAENIPIFDFESQQKLIKHVLPFVDGIFLLGTAGESPTIPSKYYDEAVKSGIKLIKQENPKMPVLVGISADNSKEMIRRAKLAERYGADALVLVPLFGQEEPAEKFNKLLKSTLLPIVLYDNPGIHTGENKGKDLSFEFVKKAKEESNGRVIGIKITSSNRQMFEECLKLQDDTFHVLQGGANVDTLRMEVEGQKVQGVVSFEAVILPTLINLLLKYPEDIEIQRMVSELGESTINPKAVKELLKAMGIIATGLMFKD